MFKDWRDVLMKGLAGKSNIVDMVKNWIQNALLTAIDRIITPRIELAVTPINASSGRDNASIMGNSERGEHFGDYCLF